MMRFHAAELNLDLDVKDKELTQLLLNAQQVGNPCPIYRKGDRFTAKPASFLVNGLIRAHSANVIVGQPKVGKSTLALALAKALHDRDETFLGRAILHPAEPMPVLVFGTDQGEEDWIPYLQSFGLMNDEQKMLGNLEFFVSVDGQNEYNFSRTGVARMKEEVQKHPGALVIIDSLTSMMEPLGMDENLSQFSGPIRNAIKELTGTGATILFLHHTTKHVVCWDWVEACRGSSSISSVFSWGVLARWLVADNDLGVRSDTRVGLTAKGRGQSPTGGILAQYIEGVGWGLCGSLIEAQKLEQAREAWINLPRSEAALFEILEQQLMMDRHEISNAELASQLNWTSSNTSRSAASLSRRGLIRLSRVGEGRGAPRWWALTEVAIRLIDSPVDLPEQPPAPVCDSLIPVIQDVKNHKNHGNQHSVGEQPGSFESQGLPPPNTAVERCIDGIWSNGWLLHHSSVSSHQVTVWRELSGRTIIQRKLRWMLDVRPCQSNPTEFDF